jgi:hypothetical protein
VRRRLALQACLVAILVASVSAPRTLAVFGDAATASKSLTTDTLDPPTSLAATNGALTTTLSWVPSVDAYTAGYEIWRSTTSGSGHALVTTITPGSASSTTNTPGGTGVFFYVLRSSFQNWRSVNSSEASATIGTTTTALRGCGTSAADTGGDGNGYERNTANACANDGADAEDRGSGVAGRSTACDDADNDRHRFRDFTLGLPGTVGAVNGILVRADEGMNNNGGTSRLCAELSWNGGADWTAAKAVTLTGTAEATYLFGGAADTWGRTWTAAELSNANFRVRITDATSTNKTYLLDFLAVAVTYTP